MKKLIFLIPETWSSISKPVRFTAIEKTLIHIGFLLWERRQVCVNPSISCYSKHNKKMFR